MTVRPFGIRARTTLISTIVVVVAFAIGSAAIIAATRYALRSSIAASATTRAADIALLAHAGGLPSVLPGRSEALLAQVVDAADTVVASSGNIGGESPLSTVKVAAGQVRTFDVTALPDDATGTPDPDGGAESTAPYLIVVQGVETTAGPSRVIVAASLNPLETTSDALTSVLLYGMPAMALLVALVVWAMTGWALRPVEAIRSEAESISSSLDRRLPVPAARDEVRDLAETMNHMLDRIEASSLAQRQFTANASHELKSPIAAIRTMLEVAQRDQHTAPVSELIDDLLAEDRRLEMLVSDLLVLARLDEGNAPMRPRWLDLGELAAEEAETVRRPNGVPIESTCTGPVRVNADDGRLRQVLRNLLDNAVRHAAGRVWVACRAADGAAILTVSDDGPGVPSADRERVFERFVRLDSNRSRGEGGTGLGLAVSRALVEAHGGTIALVEPLRGGATVEVRLPLAR